MIMHPQELSC